MVENMPAFHLLVAEDDEHDFFFLKESLNQNNITNLKLSRVSDGIELLDFLRNSKNSKPSLILLDLNMPKKDGREALKELKEDPELAPIPVIVFTTSVNQTDVNLVYDLGASAYVVKPTGFGNLTAFMKSFADFWFNTATLPVLS